MDEGKQPIVIELTTNLRTGVTALAGVTAAPCPKCRGQNTALVDGRIECRGSQCKEETKTS